MINRIGTFVGFLDQFGGNITLSVQNNQKLYKTFLGAASSLIIYILGLIYFLYLLTLYASNQIPPNLTQVSQFIDGAYEYTFQTPYVAYSMMQSSNPSLVYFNSELSLMHNGYQVADRQIIQKTGCEQYLPEDYYALGCLDQNYKISLNLSSPGTEYYQVLKIWKCQKELLNEGQICATEKQINDFVQNQYFQIIVFLQEYDYKSRKVRSVAKYFYIHLKQDTGQNLNFQVSIFMNSRLVISILMRDGYYKIFNHNASPFTFNASSYTSKDMPYQPLSILTINLNPQIQQISVQFPKVGVLLAQFQSVFSVILLAGVLIQYLSEREGNSVILQGLIQRVFPRATQIQVKALLNDDNPKNIFYHQTFIKLKSIEEVLKQIIELRMITTLLLSNEQVIQMNNLGMSYEVYQKYLHPKVETEMADERRLFKHNTISSMNSQKNHHKSSSLSALTSFQKIQPINIEEMGDPLKQPNHLNINLIKQFNIGKSSKQEQIPLITTDGMEDIKKFDQRFQNSCV